MSRVEVEGGVAEVGVSQVEAEVGLSQVEGVGVEGEGGWSRGGGSLHNRSCQHVGVAAA